MAFNIFHSLTDVKNSINRRVYYVLMSEKSSNDQLIYENFFDISALFRNCVKADEEYLRIIDSDLQISEILKKPSFTFGFIYSLLKELSSSNINTFRTSDSLIKILPKSSVDIFALMDELKISNTRPVFIVDECAIIQGNNNKKIVFIKNLFRGLGFGLVMLGTDSRAARLLEIRSGSSRSGLHPKPWCYIFSDFPPISESLLNGLPADFK